MNIVEVNYNWEKPWANISTDELKNDLLCAKVKEQKRDRKAGSAIFFVSKPKDFPSSGNVEER